MVWDPLERYLWGIVFAMLIVGAILYFLRGKNRENFNERTILFGFGFYFIGFAFARFFYCLGDVFIPGIYMNNAFYGDYDKVKSSFEFFVRLNYISRSIGIALFLLAFEINFKRTKYILTTVQSIFIVLIIILPFSLARYVNHTFAVPFNFTAICVILYKYTKWSRLELKPISSFLFFGICLMNLGLSLAGRDVKNAQIIPLYIAPIAFGLGVLFAITPLIIKPKYFSRSLSFWVIIGFLPILSSLIILLIPTITILVIIRILIYMTIWILFSILILYQLCKDIKAQSKDTLPNILEMFTKPQKVTEEEVSISKEKKICLVCKGKVGGIMFMCVSCGTFYCIKCSEALSNLENACWACNEVIDKSKPVRLNNSEEEKVLVEKEMGEGYKNSK